MQGLLARAGGSQGRTAASMPLLQRRNEQLGQEQGLQSNSLKKKILSIDSTLTLRERAGSKECPSSVGILNTLHFPSSAPSVPNSDYSKRAHPSLLRSAWKAADRSGAEQCLLPAPAHQPCSGAQAYSHPSGTRFMSPSKASLTREL